MLPVQCLIRNTAVKGQVPFTPVSEGLNCPRVRTISGFFCTRSFRSSALLSSALIALWPSDSGWRYCADAVDTSAARGQRLVPKNTWPLAFLQTVASHGAVLSEPASEQQAGHSNPLFSVHMGLHCHIP